MTDEDLRRANKLKEAINFINAQISEVRTTRADGLVLTYGMKDQMHRMLLLRRDELEKELKDL